VPTATVDFDSVRGDTEVQRAIAIEISQGQVVYNSTGRICHALLKSAIAVAHIDRDRLVVGDYNIRLPVAVEIRDHHLAGSAAAERIAYLRLEGAVTVSEYDAGAGRTDGDQIRFAIEPNR
jgi:hypothetical protein